MKQIFWTGLVVISLVGLAGCKSDPCQPSWFGRLLGRSKPAETSMMDCDCAGMGSSMGMSMAPPMVDEPILTAPQKVTDANKKVPEEKFVQPTPFKPAQ